MLDLLGDFNALAKRNNPAYCLKQLSLLEAINDLTHTPSFTRVEEQVNIHATERTR